MAFMLLMFSVEFSDGRDVYDEDVVVDYLFASCCCVG